MVQYVVPDSTIDDTDVTIIGAATAHEATDEGIQSGTPDDATTVCVISIDDFSTGTLIVGLENPSPPANNSGHKLRVRINGRGSGSPQLFGQWLVQLRQGSTVIKADTAPAAEGWSTFLTTLTNAEAAAITDYTNLNVRMKYGVGAGATVQVSTIELELPDR